MENQRCQKPRAEKFTHGAPLFLAVFALSVGNAACGIVIPDPDPECPNITDVCPNLACDAGFAQDDEGCFICECVEVEPPPPVVCWDDDECGDGQRCDLENYCETPPGCATGEACDAVCYGRCVDVPDACDTDADCASDEICRHGAAVDSPEARPAMPDDEADPIDCADGTDCMPPPSPGVCVPAECADRQDLAFPACPPGSIAYVDFENDPCGEVKCIPVDDCRDLSPEQCDDAIGCHLEEISNGCGGDSGADDDGARLCQQEIELICVPDEGTECRDLSPEECDENPSCRGEWYNVGCGDEPYEADCAEDGCGAPVQCEQQEEFVCIPRDDDSCTSDYDCAPGNRCDIEWQCIDYCVTSSDGTTECWGECYVGEGQCVPDTTSCYELSPEQCEWDPRCMLEYYDTPEPGQADPAPCFCDDPNGECFCDPVAQCVPRPAQICYSDDDCDYGQRCDLEEYCAGCDEDDFNCFAPCFVEGVCVDDGPNTCDSGNACPPGYDCDVVVVCESCGGGGVDPDGNGFMAPPPDEDCIGQCWEETICVPSHGDDLCYSDDDCGGNSRCNMDVCLSDPNCPECDVCVGICEEQPGEQCWTDDDCGGNQICNTWDYCDSFGPDMPGGLIACLGRCEEAELPPNACLANNDCGEGERCATELDFCYCPDEVCTFEQPCMSMCVSVDEGSFCLDDSNCGNGQACVTTDPVCLEPGDPNGAPGLVECGGICLSDDPPPPPPAECYIDDDCGEGFRCEFNPACLPGEICSQCVPDDVNCIQVIQAAVGPNGQCEVFPTPCDVPADWEFVDNCPN